MSTHSFSNFRKQDDARKCPIAAAKMVNISSTHYETDGPTTAPARASIKKLMKCLGCGCNVDIDEWYT